MSYNVPKMKCPICNKEFTAKVGSTHTCENCGVEFVVVNDTHGGE